MTLLALGGGALVTYVLRVGFIALAPTYQLSPKVRRTLPHVGPAVIGAMIVTMLVGHGGLLALVVPSARHAALLVAALVAWRVRNVALTMAAALAVMVAAELLT